MGTIYRKTAKGSAEIETRAMKLAPRFRQLLILVDGRRSSGELVAMVPQAGANALEALVVAGLIEAIGETHVAEPQAAYRRIEGGSRRGPGEAPPTSLESMRLEAARALTELLGPPGDALALRLERSQDAAELAQLVDAAGRAIAQARGRFVAAEFVQRFGRTGWGDLS